MRTTPSGPRFSATDLAAFLECVHKTALDLRAAEGELERPGQSEIERRLLAMRGGEHERRVLESYEKSGKNVVIISAQPGAEGSARAAEETLVAMTNGADVIYQGALSDGAWSGRPDFLVKNMIGAANAGAITTKWWTPSSRARPGRAPCCSSASTPTI